MPNCSKCKIFMKPDDLAAIRCIKCAFFWHLLCAGLRTTPRDKHNWRCDTCKMNHSKKPVKTSTSLIDAEGIVTNIKGIRLELDSIKKDIGKDIPKSKLSLEERVAAIEAKLLDLETIGGLVSSLYLRMAILEERNQYMEQYERVKNLELHGLTEHENEQLDDIVHQIAVLLKVTLSKLDVKWVGRVGNRNQKNRFMPRPILIIFNDQTVKNLFMRTMRKARGVKMAALGYADDNKKVFVRENLTPVYRDIFQRARQLPNFEFAWTYNCRVYIRKDRDSQPIQIKTKRQLNTMFFHYDIN